MKHDWFLNMDSEFAGDDTESEYARKIDVFRYEGARYCNGPECRRCGLKFCEHCSPELYETECKAPRRHYRPDPVTA